MIRELRKALRDVRNRVFLTVSRGALRLVDDSTGLQQLQVGLLAGETRGSVEHFQNYGFSSVAGAGAEALILCLGGSRDHPVAAAVVDRTLRVKNLQPGEVCVYGPKGQTILMQKDGHIIIKSGNNMTDNIQVFAGDIDFTAQNISFTGKVEINGSLNVDENITCQANISASGRITSAH
jgi:phage baseplate assembly protein V